MEKSILVTCFCFTLMLFYSCGVTTQNTEKEAVVENAQIELIDSLDNEMDGVVKEIEENTKELEATLSELENEI